MLLLRHLLAACLVTQLLSLVASDGTTQNDEEAKPVLASTDSDLRIAVVNSQAFHHEILAGVLEVLKPYREQVSVFVHKDALRRSLGLKPFIAANGYSKGSLSKLPKGDDVQNFDVAIFVSPQYNLGYVKAFIKRSRPAAVVLFVHDPLRSLVINPGHMTLNTTAATAAMATLQSLHPNVLLAALSPHVVRYMREQLGVRAFWWLSVMQHLRGDELRQQQQLKQQQQQPSSLDEDATDGSETDTGNSPTPPASSTTDAAKVPAVTLAAGSRTKTATDTVLESGAAATTGNSDSSGGSSGMSGGSVSSANDSSRDSSSHSRSTHMTFGQILSKLTASLQGHHGPHHPSTTTATTTTTTTTVTVHPHDSSPRSLRSGRSRMGKLLATSSTGLEPAGSDDQVGQSLKQQQRQQQGAQDGASFFYGGLTDDIDSTVAQAARARSLRRGGRWQNGGAGEDGNGDGNGVMRRAERGQAAQLAQEQGQQSNRGAIRPAGVADATQATAGSPTDPSQQQEQQQQPAYQQDPIGAVAYSLGQDVVRPAADACSPAVLLTRTSVPLECLNGFTLQGNLEPGRRNYSTLWEELHGLPEAELRRTWVTVLGAAPPLKGMLEAFVKAIPAPVRDQGAVRIALSLPYGSYYETIQNSVGMLTLFATQAYYETKISSTVVTSLITGTPMLVTRQALQAYTFLDEDCVYLQGDDETSLAAMQRMLALGPNTWRAKRAALRRAAARVNARASRGFVDLLGIVAAKKAALRRAQEARRMLEDHLAAAEHHRAMASLAVNALEAARWSSSISSSSSSSPNPSMSSSSSTTSPSSSTSSSPSASSTITKSSSTTPSNADASTASTAASTGASNHNDGQNPHHYNGDKLGTATGGSSTNAVAVAAMIPSGEAMAAAAAAVAADAAAAANAAHIHETAAAAAADAAAAYTAPGSALPATADGGTAVAAVGHTTGNLSDGIVGSSSAVQPAVEAATAPGAAAAQQQQQQEVAQQGLQQRQGAQQQQNAQQDQKPVKPAEPPVVYYMGRVRISPDDLAFFRETEEGTMVDAMEDFDYQGHAANSSPVGGEWSSSGNEFKGIAAE